MSDPCTWRVSNLLPEGNAIFKELKTCTDQNRIQETYDYVLQTIAEESIMVPLFHQNGLAVYNSDVIVDCEFGNAPMKIDVSKITLK